MPEPTARCAACRIPIARGKFLIVREFVFHPGCVDRPILAELERDRAQAAAAEGSAVISDMSATRTALRARAEKAEAEQRTTRLAYDSVSTELAGARARNEILEQELARARAELEVARERAAAAATVKEDAGDDLRDASSIRFGLLELK